MWRKYNDGYVTEIADTSEIFVQEPGDRPATPYFLVYIKDEEKEALVDAVCREPVELPQQVQDTVMEDCSPILELPATEAQSHRPVHEYDVTESYQSEHWNQDPTGWDSTTREAPITGW